MSPHERVQHAGPKRSGHGRSSATDKCRRKVKTGCRTCKNRKVKCDEGRPACTRCLSTDRVCEGYGIWGGGNIGSSSSFPTSSSSSTTSSSASLLHRHPSPINPLPPFNLAPTSHDEQGFLEWFQSKAAVKFRGPFASPFWETLVLHASLEQPAIFHATLALSSIHKRICFGVGSTELERAPDRLEQFTLRQYSEALRLLQPHHPRRHDVVVSRHGPERDTAATRVALIACMLFICLEFIRGRYRTGNKHLQSGMKLLTNLEAESGRGSGLLRLRSRVPVDDYLAEAFNRMNLLAVQFGHGYRRAESIGPNVVFEYHRLSHGMVFESITEARRTLDHLLENIFQLSQECCRRDHKSSVGGTAAHVLLLMETQQKNMQADLRAWFSTYKASRSKFQTQRDLLSKLGYQLLSLYFSMATIMAATCLAPQDEMAFDAHCGRFASLVADATEFLTAVRAIHTSTAPHLKLYARGAELFIFNADIGWTPPLYYTAMHCRSRSVRVQAMALLRALPSKEGIWDSQFAASVAHEVMCIEEGDRDQVVAEAISWDTRQCAQDNPSKPVLPASRRVHDVQIILPDSVAEKAVLICKQGIYESGFTVITKELPWNNSQLTTAP